MQVNRRKIDCEHEEYDIIICEVLMKKKNYNKIEEDVEDVFLCRCIISN